MYLFDLLLLAVVFFGLGHIVAENPYELLYLLAHPVAFLFVYLTHGVYMSFFGEQRQDVAVYDTPPLPPGWRLAACIGLIVGYAGSSFADAYGYNREYVLVLGVAILAHIAYRWYSTRLSKPCG